MTDNTADGLWERVCRLDHENKVLRAVLEHWRDMFETVAVPGTDGGWLMERTKDALEFSDPSRGGKQ